MLCFYVKYRVLRFFLVSGEGNYVSALVDNILKRDIEQRYKIAYKAAFEDLGLLLAARQTKCENLLLLTDHESGEIEEDGHKMKVQPVYEWSLELGV